MTLEQISIRTIEEKDNAVLANIIRKTLKEFGAAHPGTVYYDAATDALFELFNKMPCSVYYVAEATGHLIGGGGIFPSEGLPADTAELVKMYLLPEARRLGLGRKMVETCIAFAKTAGYKNIYLETMPELGQAMKLYEKLGFDYLKGPMGNTGHHGCTVWMWLSLSAASGGGGQGK